jgi:hypothetical protein
MSAVRALSCLRVVRSLSNGGQWLLHAGGRLERTLTQQRLIAVGQPGALLNHVNDVPVITGISQTVRHCRGLQPHQSDYSR